MRCNVLQLFLATTECQACSAASLFSVRLTAHITSPLREVIRS